MTALIRWFRSPKVGVVSFRVRKQMSYRASLSRIWGRHPRFSSSGEVRPCAKHAQQGALLRAVRACCTSCCSAEHMLEPSCEEGWDQLADTLAARAAQAGQQAAARAGRAMHSSAFSTSWCTDSVQL